MAYSYLVSYHFSINNTQAGYGNINITTNKELAYKDLEETRNIIKEKDENMNIIILNIIKMKVDEQI